MFYRDRRRIYHATSLEEISWLRHGFGTRHSSGLPPGRWLPVSVRQVHSRRVLSVNGPAGTAGEGDGLVTSRPGILLTIRTADCLPILMAATQHRAVAAVHAGWRGTATGIVTVAVQRLCEEFAASPAEIRVAIGPGIGPCCYRVGAEVLRRFGGLFPEWEGTRAGAQLDLAEANRRQLLAAGVPEENIECGAPCTGCHPEEFHSYRRDGAAAGRMVSMIGIASPATPSAPGEIPALS